ncbi:MAG TPA: SIR2 family protein [Thermoanaerobaculia bacterium]|nr:SIR2 family protein [Thermoanaerobaculia bacterium]
MSEAPEDAVLVGAAPADVTTIAGWIRQKRCVLFLGAGVHSLPPPESHYQYADSERPRGASELIKHLAEMSRYADDYPDEVPNNLGRISLYFETKRPTLDRSALITEVRKLVQTGKRPSSVVRGLAALDFPLIATTNYDQLIEDALREHRKRPVISVYKRKSKESTDTYAGSEVEPTPEEPFVLKIHGDINKEDSIVITDEDYIHFMLRMRDAGQFDPVPPVFRYQFTTYATLFIGYSLLDYNLRLLFKALRWEVEGGPVRPPSYAVDPKPDRLIRDVYGDQHRFVHFIVRDVWSFVPMLYRELKGTEMPE